MWSECLSQSNHPSRVGNSKRKVTKYENTTKVYVILGISLPLSSIRQPDNPMQVGRVAVIQGARREGHRSMKATKQSFGKQIFAGYCECGVLCGRRQYSTSQPAIQNEGVEPELNWSCHVILVVYIYHAVRSSTSASPNVLLFVILPTPSCPSPSASSSLMPGLCMRSERCSRKKSSKYLLTCSNCKRKAS